MKVEETGGCLSVTVIFILDLVAGMMSVNYILGWFNKDIPWFADMFIGMFAASISVPVAFVGWILKACGVF